MRLLDLCTGASSEADLHVMAYELYPQLGAVVHAHPPQVQVLSGADRVPDCSYLVEGEQLLTTLRVDRATDLVRLEESDLQPAGTVIESRLVECVVKVGAEIVHVLDVNQLAALEKAGVAASTAPTITEPSP